MGTITLATLVLAACSSDTTEAGEEADPPTSATAEETSEEVTPPPGGDEAEETSEGPTDDGAETEAPADDDSETEAPAEDDSESDEPTEEADAADVIEVEPGAAFLTGDVNIVCVLGPDGEETVICDPAATAEPIDVLEEAGCDPANQRPVIVLAEGTVTGDCWDDLVAPEADVAAGGAWVGDGLTTPLWDGMEGAVLEDGQTLRTPTHECTASGEDTVTCQDLDGEHGYTLSMSEFETW